MELGTKILSLLILPLALLADVYEVSPREEDFRSTRFRDLREVIDNIASNDELEVESSPLETLYSGTSSFEQLSPLPKENTIVQVFKSRYGYHGAMFLLEDKTLWHTYHDEELELQIGDLLDKEAFFFRNFGTLENPLEIATITNYRAPFTAGDLAAFANEELNEEENKDRVGVSALMTLTNGTHYFLSETQDETTEWQKKDEIYYLHAVDETSDMSVDTMLNVSKGQYERFPTEVKLVSKQIDKSSLDTVRFIGERETWNIGNSRSITIPSLPKKELVYCIDTDEYSITFPLEDESGRNFVAFILKEKFQDEKSLSGKRLYIRQLLPITSNQAIFLWRLQ